MTDFETFNNDWERHRQTRAKINEQNKAALFDELTATNITIVTVHFDGEGDSGQINSISAFAGDLLAELPTKQLTLQQLHWGQTESVNSDSGLEAAIESLCYDYLAQEHDGWENNDGAYGEFFINVAARTIELEFYSRYTDYSKFSHTF